MIARGIVLQPEFSIDVEPGAATLYDLSRYRNHGSITGATWTQLPSGLWYLDFDGSTGFVDLGSSITHPELNTVKTLLFWVKVTGPGMIYSQATIQLSVDDTSVGQPRLIFRTGIVFTFDADSYAADTWVHLAFTFPRGDTARGFLNGVEKKTGITGALYPNAGDVHLGEQSNGALKLTGGIALHAELGNVLTPGQVRNHYEKTKHWFGVHD